jgi:hypothetical protein
LIFRKAGAVHRLHKFGMVEDAPPLIDCPVCGRPMKYLHTIRCAFADNLNVFQCKPCGFAMTEPETWTTPPRLAQQRKEGGA